MKSKPKDPRVNIPCGAVCTGALFLISMIHTDDMVSWNKSPTRHYKQYNFILFYGKWVNNFYIIKSRGQLLLGRQEWLGMTDLGLKDSVREIKTDGRVCSGR